MAPTVALAGNPNSGKTTLFNELTGSRQHVGNYPGVTVERKEGTYVRDGFRLHIVDLPGTYSLTAYSLEEVVTRDFLVNQKPEVVINIVDASNLERNLYLAIQFLEMGIPICIALNMIDVAKKRGIKVNAQKLSSLLGVPVTPTVARSGRGKKELMDSAFQIARGEVVATQRHVGVAGFGGELDRLLKTVERLLRLVPILGALYPERIIPWETQEILGIR